MNREQVLQQLSAHRAFDAHEEQMRRRIAGFVTAHELFHSRALAIGHLTASAWILDETYSHALLLHHGKLHKWLQPGGHVENDPDLQTAAWREACEESGLRDVRPVFADIFDVDVHAIPARPGEPEHDHYDIRFLFTADKSSPFVISSESKSLAWVALERITELTQEESVLRMVRRTERLKRPVR